MNEIAKWLNEGAGIQEGLRLLSINAPNPRIERLVKASPVLFGPLLVRTLSQLAKPAGAEGIQILSQSRQLRQDWPFLDKPDCPPELKILAADKITAYRTYTAEHKKLTSCSTLDECFECAKKIIENYTENRKILSEFAYYKEHGKILGKHQIFKTMKKIDELRALPVTKLLKKKKNLEDNIWRIRSEIKKNDKPHLLESRRERLRSRQLELEEVNRMIQDYEDRR